MVQPTPSLVQDRRFVEFALVSIYDLALQVSSLQRSSHAIRIQPRLTVE